jgi:cytochrome c-type biogenesis protein CcmH/NrfF
VDEHIVRVQARQKKRQDAHAIQQRRNILEKHHKRLVSQQKQSNQGVPPLATFFKLPSVAVILSSAPLTTLEKDFEKEYLPTIITSELDAWREKALDSFLLILGIGPWATSRNLLHPATRLTARFRCLRCKKLPRTCTLEECLDFSSACLHTCSPGQEWSAAFFEKDEKAFDITMRLLSVLGISAEDPESSQRFSSTNTLVHCKSCPGMILMQPQAAIGHAHRHERMDFALVSQEGCSVTALRRTLNNGLVQLLLEPSPSSEQIQTLKIFGCLHCRPHVFSPTEPTTTIDKPGAEKFFSFNGLRCHLKAKHGVGKPRDEDIYLRQSGSNIRSQHLRVLQERGFIRI